jgi:hypothetical protein
MNNPRLKRILLVLGSSLLITAVAVGVEAYIKPPVVPKNILRQVNFPVFYPEPNKQIKVQTKSFKYDSSQGQISFIVALDNRSITFAEQSSPDSFGADPNFYSAFIQKLNGYATFDSVDGTVSLTYPAQVNSQTAVMNAKGTLLFAKSTGDISENSWKLLFNSLTYTQP